MLSSDEHSGLFAFVIGLVIVIFAGIALSIAVDRRFRFSSNLSALESEISNNEPELERLRALHLESLWRLLELEPERTAASAALASLDKSEAFLERRGAALVVERVKLAESIPVMEKEYADYRAKYREMVREAAIGESLGNLTTLAGREYSNAFIMRITDADLEIRHAHGFARISARDLRPVWRDRFQWDDEARMDRLAAVETPRQVVERPPEAAADVTKPEPDSGATRRDSRKAGMLRGKVIVWRAKVSQLRQERNRALYAADGSQASVPGGLGTWQARVESLGAELDSAEAELAAAQAALAMALQDEELLKPRHAGGL